MYTNSLHVHVDHLICFPCAFAQVMFFFSRVLVCYIFGAWVAEKEWRSITSRFKLNELGTPCCDIWNLKQHAAIIG